MNAGPTNNVIADTARLELTARALSPDARDTLERRIREVVDYQARSFGCTCETQWRRGYPVLVNDTAQTQFASDVATELLGAERVNTQGEQLTASDDFAYMLEHVAGSHILIGNGRNDGPSPRASLHHPAYDFNDSVISDGSAFWVLLATRFFEHRQLT